MTGPGFPCPICGFVGLDEPPYDDLGNPTFEICPCCGNEFGYHDATRTYGELRLRWIEAGKRWWSNEEPPAGWDAEEQLKNAGLTF